MKLGTFLGASVVLNNYFLLALAVAGALGMLPAALAVFGLVVLHEMAHAVCARFFGLKLVEIELLPFGGVARLEGLIEADPDAEVRIALAGPVVSALAGGVCAALKYKWGILSGEWAELLLLTNGALAGFNLIPALPLDGGRILRARLSRKMGFRKATDIAARAGMVLSAVLALGGAYGVYVGKASASVIGLAFFLYMAAVKEQKSAAYLFMRYLAWKKSELSRYGILEARQLVVERGVSIGKVMRRFTPKMYHVILVMDEGGKILGTATEFDIIDEFFDRGLDLKIEEVLRKGA